MLLASSLAVTPSLTRNHCIFTVFTKIPLLLFGQSCHLLRYSYLKPLNKDNNSFSMNKSIRLCSTAVSAMAATHESSKTTIKAAISNKTKRKANRESPESVLGQKLNMCSKRGDLAEALRLYDDARSKGISLNQHHYNVLLYLCSSSSQANVESGNGGNDENISNLGFRRGFEIFQQMGIDKIAPNEATYTSVARLAAAMEDPDMAFDMVKRMMNSDIPPRLRSYGPALFGFCKKGDADKAYEVDAHMAASLVSPEEPELAALLGVSADVARGDRVYEMLHRLRTTVRQVSEATAETVQRWFCSDAAADVGKENWDVNKVKEGIVKGGGGWHGQGWLGKGKWKVERTEMDETGVCRTCGEKLVCIDIDPLETENFATSLSSLACKREVRADFNSFQEWLRQYGPFDAVIDGANVGLINQHNFSFFQLNSIVNKIREMSPSKRLPLIVLHQSRVYGGPAENPKNKKLIQSWKNSGALYATPVGSNDDWYWLYAAVSCKCLLVTNDEMRDHLFQLLGTNFFPRWKEKHQVRLTVSRSGPTLHMPPPYSLVIQESKRGSWHVPTVTGDDIETPRKWVCATRTPCNTLSQ
ncbi:hypothetical protein NE237_028342 [Protea cynaroides]|uniref:ribonuclease P n=1 Tax=Protea cynaroides TaxID=273540 RepID=A0A9Q0GQ40_9MAGN|nr:hypothetical protein NE237_028342 [Protea cynaroides]